MVKLTLWDWAFWFNWWADLNQLCYSRKFKFIDVYICLGGTADKKVSSSCVSGYTTCSTYCILMYIFEEIRQYIKAKFESNSWNKNVQRLVRYLRWRYPGSEKVERRKSRHHGLRRARYWASAGPATRHRRKVGYRHTCLLADWPSLTHSLTGHSREKPPS